MARKVRVVLERTDGVSEIKLLVKQGTVIPLVVTWKDGRVGHYRKTSPGGYIYYRQK